MEVSLSMEKYDSLDLQIESGSAKIIVYDRRENKKILEGLIIEIRHTEKSKHTTLRLNTGYTVNLFPEK